MEFLVFLILIVLVMSMSEKDKQPDIDPNLHQHIKSKKWHSHPYDPNRDHVHDIGDFNGPHTYVDDIVIDYRNKEH